MQAEKWQGVRAHGGLWVLRNNVLMASSLPKRVLTVTELKYEWGRKCPGARLLAMAILMDLLPAATAYDLMDDFAVEVVEKLPAEGWTLERQDVIAWLLTKEVVWQLAVGPGASLETVEDTADLPLNIIKSPPMM